MIKRQFPGLDACIDSKETSLRMNRTLRYIVNNHLPVSTPQMFVGDTRLCDEDTDMGLSYTLRKLAPGLEVDEHAAIIGLILRLRDAHDDGLRRASEGARVGRSPSYGGGCAIRATSPRERCRCPLLHARIQDGPRAGPARVRPRRGGFPTRMPARGHQVARADQRR